MTSTALALPTDTVDMLVEFLTKGYSDEDLYHIVPELTTPELETIKSQYCDTILRGMRDYYLVRKQSDDKMDYLESIALDKLETAIAIEMDSMKLLKLFQTLNSAKRRSEGEGQGNNHTTIHAEKVVQLQMPARMLKQQASPSFETNSNNEVIKVGSTDMATATNTQVLAQLQARSAEAISDATVSAEDI
jgi:hypothetical protein